RTEGYDGKGVQILRSVQDIETKAFDVPSVIEDAVDIDKEIAVIVARSSKGAVVTFPAVEMAFDPETNLVVELFSPASLTPQQDAEAKRMAMEISEKLNVVGLLAVEFFLDKSGKILVNEIAPRPHNSGHHTIEGNKTSQFEQHLRAVAGMKLGSTQIIKPAVMVNVLGEKGYVGPAVYQGRDEIEKMPGVYLHLYGKSETRPARKMGHVTILGDTVEGARVKGQVVRETLKVVSE
ncbi:MAG TPA: ATP-grasp domain-containing protein, partial [Candidatus Gracilibacteria bacterium]